MLIMAKERPHWPDQMEEHELVPGTLIQFVHTHLPPGQSKTVRIITHTITPDKFGRRVQTRIIGGGWCHGMEDGFYLADFNFEPYPSGWNGLNYIRRVGTVGEFIGALVRLLGGECDVVTTPGSHPGDLTLAFECGVEFLLQNLPPTWRYDRDWPGKVHPHTPPGWAHREVDNGR